MKRLRGNKIFAAILIALTVGLLTTLLAQGLISPHVLQTNAFKVEVPQGSRVGDRQEETMNDIKPLLAKANVVEGEKIAKKCLQCHATGKGDPNRIGPPLWNVVNQHQSKADGFAYSSAAQQLKGTWTYDELNRFLYSPRKYLPGTKMSFAGLKNDQERAHLIAYLRTLSEAPAPLP